MATKALASKTGQVKFLQKGDPGAQGPIGPLVYPSGEYSASIDYTRTALSAPMVLCEGQYYVLAKEGTFKGVNPKTDYAANGSKATWVVMDKIQYAFIEVLMANFAKLASAVFYGQYMFSQQGVDANGNSTNNYRNFGTANFTPNLLLDFQTGSFKGKEVEVQGDITANTMFLKVCTNAASASPNGAIYIGTNNIGPLPELKSGTCRVLKILVPVMTRVPVTISLTTVSSNVLIAPDASILTAVRTYNIEDAYGVYELNGFHELGSTITYWCLSKHEYL